MSKDIQEAIEELRQIKRDNESKSMIINNNTSNLQIKWSNKDLKNMADIQNRCAKENRAIETVLNYIETLEKENRKLKVRLDNGLDKDKKGCFYEDGHTGKCLGYSFFNNDEPCTYCQTCDAISIKEDD